jgi:hypothetical protein
MKKVVNINKKKSTQSRQARRRAARAVAKKSEVMNDARWNFNLKGLSFGDKRAVPGSGPAMVGLAEYSDDIQVIMPRITHEMGDKGDAIDVLSGTEFLFSVNNGGEGSEPGDILATLLIHPLAFFKTRLAQFSELYERYRFRKVKFWYKPSANATQSGQLIGYGDYDPDNVNTNNGEDNLSIAAAHLGQAVCKIWESRSFPFGIVDNYTSLFADLSGEEDRLIYQGVYYLLAGSDIDPAIIALGNLYLEYEIELIIPILQNVNPFLASIQLSNAVPSSAQTFTAPFGDSVEAVSSVPWGPNTLKLGTDIVYSVSGGGISQFALPSATVGDTYLLIASAGFAGISPTASTNLNLKMHVAGSSCTVTYLSQSGVGEGQYQISPASGPIGLSLSNVASLITAAEINVTGANPFIVAYVLDDSIPAPLTSPAANNALFLFSQIQTAPLGFSEPVPASLRKMKKDKLQFTTWGQKQEHDRRRKDHRQKEKSARVEQEKEVRRIAIKKLVKKFQKEGDEFFDLQVEKPVSHDIHQLVSSDNQVRACELRELRPKGDEKSSSMARATKLTRLGYHHE